MLNSLFGSRSKSRKKTATAKRVPRFELLEPRLTLSGSPWYVSMKPVGAAVSPMLTLNPSVDTAVNAVTPYTNYGQVNVLLVQNDSSPGATNDAETYLRFNSSGLNGAVSKAMLTLTPILLGRSVGNLTIGVQILPAGSDTAWVEGSGGANYAATGPLTWYNAPSGSGQVATIAGSQLAVDSPISLDVTSLVDQGIGTSGVASFILAADSGYGGNQTVEFASRQYLVAAYRPTLTISTAAAVVAPPPVVPPVVARAATASYLSGNTAQLSVLGIDNTPNANLVYTWSVSGPAGIPSPTFNSAASSSPTVTFFHSGIYSFTATVTDTTDGLSAVSSAQYTVGQTLSGIQVTPAAAMVGVGATQQFAAYGIDQFGQVMGSGALGGVAWSIAGGGAGSIKSASGLYSAPAAAGVVSTATVTAKIGSVTARSSVVVVSSFDGISNPTLSALTESLYQRDGSINRSDMIQILQAAESLNGGVISQGVMTDLKTLMADATELNMPGYVQVLAGDIINGNAANANYQGQPLGNLGSGSTGSELDDLIDKWFLGTDLPATGGYGYSAVSGPLFGSSGPSVADEHQGLIGDCYLISSLGTIADTAPAAIENMIVPNGDGTWTVRFFNNGKADYVTVNNELPTSNGMLVFDGYGYGTTNSPGLWIALIEKAYAQWNETGNEGRNGTNTYAGIQAGWMANVDAQVLGQAASSYNISSTSDLQALVAGMTNNEAVTIATDGQNSLPYGLYGSHAYAVTGYNPSNQTFTLYNPWGYDQPTQSLTWAQLQATCDGFVVASAAGTQVFAAMPSAAASASIERADEISACLHAAAVDSVLATI